MLTSFGLNNYENKVFMKLLELGSSDARAISNESKVPYGRIYDVLNNLESKGVIFKNNSRPQQFTAVEPKLVIDRLLQSKRDEIDELNKSAEIAKNTLNRIYERKPKDKLVWKVAVGDELHSSYFELLKEARREFLGYVQINGEATKENSQLSEYFTNYQQVLYQCKQAGVKVRMMLGVSHENVLEELFRNYPDMIQMIDFGEIRTTSTLTNPFTVIDGQKVILKVDNPSDTNEFLAAIYLWQDSLAKTLRSKFDELWDRAKPIQLKITN